MVFEIDDAWPVALLLLRVAAVAVLYLFLASAFGALRAELRPRLPAYDERSIDAVASSLDAPRDAPSRPTVSAVATPAPRLVPPRLVIVLGGLVVMVVLGSAAVLSQSAPERDAGSTTEATVADEPFGPPLREPAPGRVTVGLAAVEDSEVRVTVDGVVQFDGTLRARERQAWEGGERIQVWTNSGRTLQLAVNGTDLGAYSPAMGHPDWNRIDFGFWPGWSR